MRTEYFEYLLTVVKLGSINKASSALLMTQQRLSQVITELESEFHIQIFYRTPRGILLTPNGQIFVEKIQHILEEIYDLHTLAVSETCNTTLVGEIMIYKFPDIAAEHYAQFTSSIIQQYSHISLFTKEMSYGAVTEALISGECDIGIVLLPYNLITKVPESLEFIPILNRRSVVYMHVENPFAKKFHSTTLKALLDKPFVQYMPYDKNDSLIDQLFSNIGQPSIKCAINNLKIFFDYLKNCHYFSIGSIPCNHRQMIPDIVAIPLRDAPEICQGLLLKKENRRNPLITTFIDEYVTFYAQFST